MVKVKLSLIAALALAVAALGVAPGVAAARNNWPEVIDLPNGFQPEGIAAGRGHTLYAGSLVDGAIFAIDARTGEGRRLAEPPEGRVAAGLSFDNRSGYVFAAGGPLGTAYVYDTATGKSVGEFTLTTETSTFVNDVIVTREAAYFTDSSRPVLYRLPLGPAGRLPDAGAVEEIPLGGDYESVPDAFNANGIEATPNGDTLIIVNSTTGRLYQVDPDTGDAARIDLGDDDVTNGDGLLLDGSTLYVVQNMLNQIAVVALADGLTSGEVVEVLTDPDFDIPTTVARLGDALYVVNARFSTPPTPDTEYWIARLPAE